MSRGVAKRASEQHLRRRAAGLAQPSWPFGLAGAVYPRGGGWPWATCGLLRWRSIKVAPELAVDLLGLGQEAYASADSYIAYVN